YVLLRSLRARLSASAQYLVRQTGQRSPTTGLAWWGGDSRPPVQPGVQLPGRRRIPHHGGSDGPLAAVVPLGLAARAHRAGPGGVRGARHPDRAGPAPPGRDRAGRAGPGLERRPLAPPLPPAPGLVVRPVPAWHRPGPLPGRP